jgi:hypothetical protein
MKTTITCLLLGLLGLSGLAQADCNPLLPAISFTRYKDVEGAAPNGSEVLDTFTNLVWQRCVVGMEWDNVSRTCTKKASDLTWQDALQAALNATPSKVHSATAWRVPSHVELFSLTDRACFNPAIHINWFPMMSLVEWHWSSSPTASSARYAWAINFADGEVSDFPTSYPFPVRLVRFAN